MHDALFRPPPTTFVSSVTGPTDVTQHPTSTSPIAPIGALQPQSTSPVHVVSAPKPCLSQARVPSSQSNSMPPPVTRQTTRKRKASNIWSTSEVNVLLDLYEGEDFVNPHVVSLVENEEMAKGGREGEGDLAAGGEEDLNGLGTTPTTESTPTNNHADANDDNGMLGPPLHRMCEDKE
ncbi:hypothetical protein L7F22_016922 [Adiantum nelumboides]|nr:hypothetical protein [Adiantum nelumboides]